MICFGCRFGNEIEYVIDSLVIFHHSVSEPQVLVTY